MKNESQSNYEILHIFHKKCKELNLWYTLANKSLLQFKTSAIKFNNPKIIEIMMTIEDYSKFLKNNYDNLIDNLTLNNYYYTSPFFFQPNMDSIIKINLLIKANIKETESIYSRINLIKQKIGYYKSIKNIKTIGLFFKKNWYKFLNIFWGYLTWYEISSNIYDNENFHGYFVVDSFKPNINLNWIPSLTMKREKIVYENIPSYIPQEWDLILSKKYGIDWQNNPIVEKSINFDFIFDEFIKH